MQTAMQAVVKAISNLYYQVLHSLLLILWLYSTSNIYLWNIKCESVRKFPLLLPLRAISQSEAVTDVHMADQLRVAKDVSHSSAALKSYMNE